MQKGQSYIYNLVLLSRMPEKQYLITTIAQKAALVSVVTIKGKR